MRRFFSTISLLLITVMPTASMAEGSPTILVVGDSLSAGYGLNLGEGWTDLLSHRLESQGYEHRVVNASISGDTTSGGRARLPLALKRHQPDVVVIELGGNDGLRGFQIDVMRNNLEAMIQASQATGAAVVLLGMRIPENYGARYTEEFFNSFAELASQWGTGYVEFFMEGVALNDALMQADGIHPNADAQPRLLENAWAAIQAALVETQAAATATAL